VSELGCADVELVCSIGWMFDQPTQYVVRVPQSHSLTTGCTFTSPASEIVTTCASAFASSSAAGDIVGPQWNESQIRSENEILLDGPAVDVPVSAIYSNWHGLQESVSALLPRSELSASIAASPSAENVEDEETVDVVSLTGRRLAGGADYTLGELTSTRALASSGVEYEVQLQVTDSRYADSPHTLAIDIHGQSLTTARTVLGDRWARSEMRSVTLRNLQAVGRVAGVTLTISGRNGLLLDGLWVNHTETVMQQSAMLQIDSIVRVLRGKYEGCTGAVSRFSGATGRPRVCRNCDEQANSGVACCGGTTRTTCYYYKEDMIEPLEQSVTTSYSSYFAPTSYIKCHGSKRAKTWTCSQTLGQTLPPAVTAEPASSSTCAACPTAGQPEWQGDPPSLPSDFSSVAANMSLSCAAASTFAAGDRVRIAVPGSGVDGCPGGITELSASGASANVCLLCTAASRKGRPCCDTFSYTTAGLVSATACQATSVAIPLTGLVHEEVGITKPMTFSYGTLWLDANARGVSRFQYVARKDCGCLDRHGSFTLAPTSQLNGSSHDVQQFSGRTYPHICLNPQRNGASWSTEGLSSSQIRDQCRSKLSYDRGHMIPANHFDHDAATIRATNMMVNILPQADKMNRGAWLQTEMIVECLREEEVLTVVGGAVYPTSRDAAEEGTAQSGILRATHGVLIPTFFWKVIVASPTGRYSSDHGLLAFWMPNSIDATADKTANYVVSLGQLEANLCAHGGVPESFGVSDAVKLHEPSYWGVLEGCDRA